VTVLSLVLVGMYTANARGQSRLDPQADVSAAEVGMIQVSGNGTVEGKPDTAYISLGFQGADASVVVAQQQAASQLNAVIARLKELGVAPRDIQTSGYNIWREEKTEQTAARFVVSNTVQVVVRNVASSGKLLDGAVQAGANSVQGISFGIEDRTALESAARQKAMASADAKAQELAKLGGVQLGKAIYIVEGDTGGGPVPLMGAPAADMAREVTQIEPGQLSVQISVTVKYEIN